MEWQSQFHTLFSEYSTPEDETLGTQIVKVREGESEGVRE